MLGFGDVVCGTCHRPSGQSLSPQQSCFSLLPTSLSSLNTRCLSVFFRRASPHQKAGADGLLSFVFKSYLPMHIFVYMWLQAPVNSREWGQIPRSWNHRGLWTVHYGCCKNMTWPLGDFPSPRHHLFYCRTCGNDYDTCLGFFPSPRVEAESVQGLHPYSHRVNNKQGHWLIRSLLLACIHFLSFSKSTKGCLKWQKSKLLIC